MFNESKILERSKFVKRREGRDLKLEGIWVFLSNRGARIMALSPGVLKSKSWMEFAKWYWKSAKRLFRMR